MQQKLGYCIPSAKHTDDYGKSVRLMGELTVSMVIFNRLFSFSAWQHCFIVSHGAAMVIVLTAMREAQEMRLRTCHQLIAAWICAPDTPPKSSGCVPTVCEAPNGSKWCNDAMIQPCWTDC